MDLIGWEKLIAGLPWFSGEGSYPLPAYSEFMPSPRVGCSLSGEIDDSIFSPEEPYTWHISELEEEYELRPGLEHIAGQILHKLIKLGRGARVPHIAGHHGRNLEGNPYWPPELAARAGSLDHERFITFLPLALSKTQDDKGRVLWTLFGSSEQGPERAFWKSFYSAPGEEVPENEFLSFLSNLFFGAFGEKPQSREQLLALGFRILPSTGHERFPTWTECPLPSWTRPYIVHEQSDSWNAVRYLLTFRPFSALPAIVREGYLAGRLALLPFPGSLAFWGMPGYLHLQEQLPMAMQIPLLPLVVRHGAPGGIRVPQSGWLHESRRDRMNSKIQEDLLLNTYRRTHRWDRVHRHEDAIRMSTRIDKMTDVLFSASLDSLALYNKPMARNSQLWTEDFHLLLDGPKAGRKEIQKAAEVVLEGGLFQYRFHFPPMRVGLHEVYWHRPLNAYLSQKTGELEVLKGGPLGYFTAYPAEAPDLSRPVELWPRLRRRDVYLAALRQRNFVHDHYLHQTPLNILRLLHTHHPCGGRPLPRSFARQLLRIPREDSLGKWLNSVAEGAGDSAQALAVRPALGNILEPQEAIAFPEPVTYAATATRSFEEGFWRDILTLSHGRYKNKDNADPVEDPITRALLPHPRRDLGPLGDYLLRRHDEAIASTGMAGKAYCGDLPFRWQTDFPFGLFGGWKINQERPGRERNLLSVIPGRNRGEAVIMADHYDTAYMEDVYDKSRGGSGARLAAPGADDNHSATATLLQAAPIFLQLAKEGRLQRDIWLLHLTGEEFPSDCLGARHFCRSLIEKTLKLRTEAEDLVDLSSVQVKGVFLLDMIAHNRENGKNIFQISPGQGSGSLVLARLAHTANVIWNGRIKEWNNGLPRKGQGSGTRSKGPEIPPIALHPHVDGEVRTTDDPHSSLFNTDGQIFSDCGVPVVLFMENYDISRTGYHDSRDTMENIDLDYGSALAAIAIETVARAALAAKI